MYIKNATMFIPDNDPDIDSEQDPELWMMSNDHIDRLYTMAEGLIPCDCCCEVAITRPSRRIYTHGEEQYRSIEFRAICTKCLTSTNFVWDETFFADYTS